MSERSRKKARQAARRPKPVDLDKIAPAPTPSQRSKFRVARVQREVQDVITLSSPRRTTPERRQSDWGFKAMQQMADLPMPDLPAQPARASVQPLRKTPDQPGMHKEQKLKCPPKDNSPKGAKGSGRDFVPWNKNC